MQKNGHSELVVTPSGFFICEEHPYLGASPDGLIYDPKNVLEPFGFLEIKCPYAHRNVSPTAACGTSSSFCTLSDHGKIALKRNH